MAKSSIEKTNVMRLLDQKKVPYTPHTYPHGDDAVDGVTVAQMTGMDPAKVNPNGGAMALGHPLGATGAVLSCKAISELRRTGGKYAMVTMCIAGGMGAAGIFQTE